MATAEEPTWPEMVDRFAAFLEEEERSPHTIRNYRDDLHAFAAWYRGRYGDDPRLGQLAKQDVVDWKKSIEVAGGRKARDDDGNRTVARGARLPTVNRKLSAVRSFFRWAQAQDLGVRFDPPKPKRSEGRSKPKSLKPDERRALIKAVEGSQSTRDILLIRSGLDGGLRVSEMASLTWDRVEISERKGQMRVEGKGRKERIVPLTKPLRHAFLEHGYHRHRGKDHPVFEGQRGGLSIRGIQDIVERYGKAARVGKRQGLEGFSTHSLRHTAADWLLNEQGLSVPEVAEILGHSDIKTTMIYTTPHKDRLANRMAQIED
jgi:integrase/recombinase XerD